MAEFFTFVLAVLLALLLTWLFSLTGLGEAVNNWIKEKEHNFNRERIEQAKFPVGTPVKYLSRYVTGWSVGKVKEVYITSWGGLRYKVTGSTMSYKERELQVDVEAIRKERRELEEKAAMPPTLLAAASKLERLCFEPKGWIGWSNLGRQDVGKALLDLCQTVRRYEGRE